MLQYIPQLLEKVARSATDAEEMRDLTDDGDVDEPLK
jgi:hypothetical protein